jgi:hypothetical protein
MATFRRLGAVVVMAWLCGCGGQMVVGLDAGLVDAGPLDAGPLDAGPLDAGPLDAGPLDAGPLDAGPLDAGSAYLPDGGDPFIDLVVQFDAGAGGGYHSDRLPAIIEGPPQGTGDGSGSTDVLSLGSGGVIVVRLGQEIVDGPGPDFTVFENPFRFGTSVYAEPGIVGVSDDGILFTDFPCDPDAGSVATCAGMHPVYASSSSGISPLDPSVSGGDPLDLAAIGLTRARYVRIRDLGLGPAPQVSPTQGFDLDAIAVIHAGP